jgi:tetratricopeptide (TPR) repeat protein
VQAGQGEEPAEAQTSLGFVKFWFDWDWPAAEAAYRKAIALDPGYPMAHRMLETVLSHMGRAEEARPAMNRLRELDPLLAVNQALSGQVAFAGREYEGGGAVRAAGARRGPGVLDRTFSAGASV